MRLTAFIIVIIVFSSCTALKPVIAKKDTVADAPRNTTPRFIEHISINTAIQSDAGYIQPKQEYITPNLTANRTEAEIELLNAIQFKYAILMDVPVEAFKSNQYKMLGFIEEWYGTPYHFGGNSKSGIDCSAFTGNFMATVFGIELPRMAKDQYKFSQHVAKSDLQEGDLVFFHTTRKGISHVGVYLGNNKFIHASLNYGVTISDLGEGYYAQRLVAVGRVKQYTATVSSN